MIQSNPIRVVVAEDDYRIAQIQQDFTAQLTGFEVVGLSHTLEQTAHMVDVLKPDLLLLDVYFPDGSGLDYLKKLREQPNDTDVILITAARDIDTLKSAMHGGIFDYIVKPLAFNRFQDSLQRYQQQTLRLNSLSSIDQQMVDSLIPRGALSHQNQAVPLPKGIDELTLRKISRQFSHSHSRVPATSIGDAVGVSRTTARRYLEYMVSTGELVVDVNYGGVGRPERCYRRSGR